MIDEIIESLTTTITHPLERLMEIKKAPFPRVPDKALPPPSPLREEDKEINEVRTVSIGGFSFKIGRWQHLSQFTGSVVYSSFYTHFIGVLNHLEISTIPILIAGIGYKSMSLPSYRRFSNSKKIPE